MSFYIIGLPIGIALALAAHLGAFGLWIGLMCGAAVQVGIGPQSRVVLGCSPGWYWATVQVGIGPQSRLVLGHSPGWYWAAVQVGIGLQSRLVLGCSPGWAAVQAGLGHVAG